MWTATASTMVRKPPTVAPSRFSTGRPPCSTAMSVVVPPMSEMKASSAPACPAARARAPTTEAAGPERMVSTGEASATASLISEPSPFTTVSGQARPRARIRPCTASTSWVISGIKRAFSTAVSARRGASSAEDSRWAQVTGIPVSARIHALSASSCAGLRTAKKPATAKDCTCGAMARTASSALALSSGACGSPPALWPPARKATGSPRSASRSPARSRACGG